MISLVKLLSIDKMLVLEQCLENRKSLHCQVGCRNICVEEKKCFDVQVWAMGMSPTQIILGIPRLA